MNLLDLAVRVTLDDKASSKIGALSANIKSGLGAAAKVGVAATSAVAAGTAAVGVGFMNAAKDVAAYGDHIDKMSQKMGMSSTAYQEWDSVMRHSGTSMETMKAGMKTLANAVENGNEAFQRIGLTQEQIASMSQEELFAATIEGLQKVDNETERTYLAGQLFGRGATELGPLLNKSAEETQAMRDRVHELGGVMDEEAVKSAAAFQDSLQDMHTAMQGLKNRMMGEFLPSLTTVMDGLQEVFAGNYDEGLEKISEGVSVTVAKIGEVMPQVMETGGKIIATLIAAISENLPSLIEAMVGFVITIAQALVENIPLIINAIVECLPMMVEGGLQLFMGLLTALTEAAPQIVDGLTLAIIRLVDLIPQYLPQMLGAALTLFMAIATAILDDLPTIVGSLLTMLRQLVAYVVENAPQMLSAGAELMMALLSAIGSSTGKILDEMGNLLRDAIDAVGGAVGDMVSAGGDFIMGFVEGIANSAGEVIDAAIGAVEDAVDGVLGFLGIASPSKLMMRFGGFTMEGFAEGIEDAASMAQNAMEEAAAGVYDAASGEVDITARAAYETAPVQPAIEQRQRDADSRIIELLEALLMKDGNVYLDGSELVKSTIGRTDMALGARQLAANRGVAL